MAKVLDNNAPHQFDTTTSVSAQLGQIHHRLLLEAFQQSFGVMKKYEKSYRDVATNIALSRTRRTLKVQNGEPR